MPRVKALTIRNLTTRRCLRSTGMTSTYWHSVEFTASVMPIC